MLSKLPALPVFALFLCISACETPAPPARIEKIWFQPFTTVLADQLGSDKLTRGLQFYVSYPFNLEGEGSYVRTEMDSRNGGLRQIYSFRRETISIMGETECIVPRTERSSDGLTLMVSFEEGNEDLTLPFKEQKSGLFVLDVNDEGEAGFFITYNNKRYRVICDQPPYLLVRIDNVHNEGPTTRILRGRKLPL